MTITLKRHAPGSYKVVELPGTYVEKDPLDMGDDRWFVIEETPDAVGISLPFKTRADAEAFIVTHGSLDGFDDGSSTEEDD